MTVAGGQRDESGGISSSNRRSSCSRRRSRPARVVALPHARHPVRSLRRDQAGEDGSLGVAAHECANNGQDFFHPGCRPRTLRGENPLHIHTKMDASLSQGKRQQLISHGSVAPLVRAIAAISMQVQPRQAMPLPQGGGPQVVTAQSSTR